MIPQNHTGLVLPTVRLILGICAVILSLIFSILFISEGSSGAGILSAIVFCVITEFCKVTFTTDLAYFYTTRQADKALFAAVLVVILFALSISAAVFSLTINPARQETTLKQADSQVSTLETAITAKKAQLSSCNANYLTKCVNPRTQELQALESHLNAILKQSENLAGARASAEFWKKAADYLGTNPNDLQLNFAIARAVLLDLLGLVLISQYTSAKRLQSEITRGDNAPVVNHNEAVLRAEIENLRTQLESRPNHQAH